VHIHYVFKYFIDVGWPVADKGMPQPAILKIVFFIDFKDPFPPYLGTANFEDKKGVGQEGKIVQNNVR
jgi:hypothetical protein